MLTLGFDTSNYTTSVAAFDGVGGRNCSRLLDVKPGELGLRQSDALFAHVKRLPELVQALCASVELKDITAIGVSYFLQNAAQLIWSSSPKNFTSIVTFQPLRLAGGQLVVTGEVIYTIAASVIIMLGLTWFTTRTRTGKAMRAVSEDRDAAQLMGINVNQTISMTFAIGSALAAVAGVLLCSTVPTLQPTTGSMPGIRAFTAAVFGGIGSIPGAMLGGILLGVIETFSKAYLSPQFSDAIVFAVLIVILLVKPAGLLGKQVQEKV